MADRRRRKLNGSEDSEDVSESSEEEQGAENVPDLDTSAELNNKVEYVSAEEEEEEEEEDEEHEEENGSDADKVYNLHDGLDYDLENPAEEEGGQEGTADILEGEYIDDDEDWKDEQREDGDGEESEVQQNKEKVLDFDEDRRNPQYIPKKGGFYEHDDRLYELGQEEEDKEKKKGKIKKLWKDEGKWMHDRYQEDAQNPKSRDELVALYGYDIRNEDGPPRARRRRRYGRGPSKYTRKWEDEDAYGKVISEKGPSNRDVLQRGSYRGRGRRGSQTSYNARTLSEKEFPKLGGELDGSTEDRSLNNDNKNLQNVKVADVNDSVEITGGGDSNVSNEPQTEENSMPNSGFRTAPRVSHNRGFRGRRRAGRNPRHNFSHRPSDKYESSRRIPKEFLEAEVEDVTKEMDRVALKGSKESKPGTSIQSKEGRKEAKVAPTPHNSGSSQHERRQAAVPPRLQDAVANRPKRYSSQRQRQVPESGLYPQNQSPQQSASVPLNYYETGYEQPVYSDHNPVNGAQQGNTTLIPNQHYQGYEAPYQEAYAVRPMASPPRVFPRVPLVAGQPVMPAPYIATGGNIMSYGPPPAAYTQYQFQQFQAAPPPPPVGDPLDNTLSALQPQPQEIFRGGMAYYNAQPPVRTLPKRPRAAIPIVPPPELEDVHGEDNVVVDDGVETAPCDSSTEQQTQHVEN